MAEGLDLIVGAGVLVAELVAWETDDGEVLGVFALQVLVELLEALKLRGKATFGGGVDDQDDLAGERGEGEGSTLLCSGLAHCQQGTARGHTVDGLEVVERSS